MEVEVVVNIVIQERCTEYYIVEVEEERYEYSPYNRSKNPGWDQLWLDVDKWCEKTFGEQGAWGGPAGQWKRMGPKYYFATEEEQMLFVLRWS